MFFLKPVKNDEGKSRMDLIPANPLLEVGKVFGHGAKKYTPNNYRTSGGLKHSRLSGAALRHTYQYLGGEDIDESGHHHLAHAIASLLMLYEQVLRNPEQDDRFVP